VANIHFPGSAGISFVILRKLGFFRLVTSAHGADLLPEGKRAPAPHLGLKELLGHSDLIIVPSKGFQDAVQDVWPELATRPIAVVPNGVDPTELGYVEGAVTKTATPPYILSVLQLVDYKGADVLIRAFASVCQDYPGLRLKLGSDGPNRKDYEALAERLGIRERVDFLGLLERAEIAAQLRGCSFFVLPSRTNSESFGIAAAEAMALDKAVIVSRIGGLPTLVEDGETGLLVPPGDDAELASAIRRLLDDPEETRRLGRNAGKRVRENFLWRNTGELYVQAFTRVMKKTKTTSSTPMPELASVGSRQDSGANRHGN
jgi:glycosyltransferase involved in cell wall biosynthesis